MLVAERKTPQEIKKLAESCEEKIRDGKMTFNQVRECFGLPQINQKRVWFIVANKRIEKKRVTMVGRPVTLLVKVYSKRHNLNIPQMPY